MSELQEIKQDIRDLGGKLDKISDKITEGQVQFENHHLRIEALEDAKESRGGKLWDLVRICTASVVGAVVGVFVGRH